jgi:hypothetical protein
MEYHHNNLLNLCNYLVNIGFFFFFEHYLDASYYFLHVIILVNAFPTQLAFGRRFCGWSPRWIRLACYGDNSYCCDGGGVRRIGYVALPLEE